MQDVAFIIFQILILLFSAIIHEISHGVMALRYKDYTAYLSGRLSFNPLVHLDLYGSIILPMVLLVVTNGGFMFGYAKPVPYNPRNFTNIRQGTLMVALAGPLSNFLIALAMVIIFRLLGLGFDLSMEITKLFVYVVLINVFLGIFNSMPIPPLDGSKVLQSLLPQDQRIDRLFMQLEQYGMFLVLIFAVFVFPIFANYVYGVAFWFLGV
jgi:Zn-dependent protease